MMSVFRHFAAEPQTPITISPSDLHLNDAPTTLSSNSVETLLGTVYLIAGIVAVLAIIIGSIRFITAGGDSGQVASAKNVITYAVIGLVVVIVAAIITQFVIENIAR